MNKMPLNTGWVAAFAACATAVAVTMGPGATWVRAADKEPIDPAPTLKDYSGLATLPDWSGTWTPDVIGQVKQEKSNPPPWKPEIAKQIMSP